MMDGLYSRVFCMSYRIILIFFKIRINISIKKCVIRVFLRDVEAGALFNSQPVERFVIKKSSKNVNRKACARGEVSASEHRRCMGEGIGSSGNGSIMLSYGGVLRPGSGGIKVCNALFYALHTGLKVYVPVMIFIRRLIERGNETGLKLLKGLLCPHHKFTLYDL